MLSEKQIQEKIIDLIKNHKFHDVISKDSINFVENILKNASADNILPDFSIDYYIRKNIAQSMKNVLDTMHSLKVLTDDKNISVTKGQYLRPDIVCLNQETKTLIIFELKKSVQTERQALTELLAYEHELKNTLPFLANYDIQFVLISTDWSTLLQHASASAITWSKKNLLCLKLNATDVLFDLEVIFPDAWKLTGLPYFPKESISSMNLCLDRIDSALEQEEIQYRVSIAVDHLVREAEIAGLHGFIVVSEDYASFFSPEEYHIIITFCSVSPLVFLKEMLEVKSINDTDGHLVKPLLEAFSDYDINQSISSLYKIASKVMKPFLDKFCHSTFEAFRPWEYSRDELEDRGLPIEMNCWGIIGEYVRDYLRNPAVMKHQSQMFPTGIADWKNPIFGLQLIQFLTIPKFMASGQLNLSDIFKLGLMIRYDDQLRKNYEETKSKNLECLLFWHSLLIPYTLEEITNYISGIKSSEKNCPIIKYSPNIKANVDWEPFISWVGNNLLPDDYYRAVFELGLNLSLLISFTDLSYRRIVELPKDFESSKLKQELNEFLNSIIQSAKNSEFIINPQKIEYILMRIRSCLNLSESDKLETAIENLPIHDIGWVLSDILKLSDFSIPYIANILEPVSHDNIDWDNLKQGIDLMYQNGVKYPAIYIQANGKIGTANYDENPHMCLAKIKNTDIDVYLFDESRGFPVIITIVKWETLRSGKVNQ
ncbi:hypothetical protein [Wohlfahrtiimonas chitiniclastica]|uniref:hypothetical protein n=1 Tax=Wohlfahrtiimonas chitiniclastica TaxID=400946 RepID=UPI000B98AB10|nr:hypothetical protein [Wohlfahrtiimonas chitiniclastica]OYQ74002.1 hypothetical protein B9T18_07750 [Wohlfahrtiimonas chitiniclastica]